MLRKSCRLYTPLIMIYRHIPIRSFHKSLSKNALDFNIFHCTRRSAFISRSRQTKRSHSYPLFESTVSHGIIHARSLNPPFRPSRMDGLPGNHRRHSPPSLKCHVRLLRPEYDTAISLAYIRRPFFRGTLPGLPAQVPLFSNHRGAWSAVHEPHDFAIAPVRF